MYMLTPHNTVKQPYVWMDNVFSTEELDYLQEKTKNSTEVATVGNGIENLNARRSQVSWLSESNDNNWIFDRIGHTVSTLNSQFYNFELTGFGESMQLTCYKEENQGMYNWHVDFGSNVETPSRKLSVVVQLSDPVDYEGGVLELMAFSNEVTKISKKRGLLVAFPSWTLHRVTPVTQGIRTSLVCWISGPPFK